MMDGLVAIARSRRQCAKYAGVEDAGSAVPGSRAGIYNCDRRSGEKFNQIDTVRLRIQYRSIGTFFVVVRQVVLMRSGKK